MDATRSISSPAVLTLRADLPVPEARVEAAPAIRNVLTIDVEDWPIAVLGPHYLISDRVLRNTERLMAILRRHGVKATFFVLTKVAQVYPDLIRSIAADGHEIASHGHSHRLLTAMSPPAFADDVRRSIDILGELVGERPMGYRAPAFSVLPSTRWAGPILADLGFQYSSSVFPIHHRRYGNAGAPRHIHRWSDCRLIECPPATFRLLGQNLPVAGGGYFRLLPGAVARSAIRRLNRSGMPAILYTHPYELDVEGVRFHMDCGLSVSPVRHVMQSLFRSRMERRLDDLLDGFRFTTLRDLLNQAA